MDANWPELDRARRCGVKLAEDVTSFGAGRLGIWPGLEMGARSGLAGWLAGRTLVAEGSPCCCCSSSLTWLSSTLIDRIALHPSLSLSLSIAFTFTLTSFAFTSIIHVFFVFALE